MICIQFIQYIIPSSLSSMASMLSCTLRRRMTSSTMRMILSQETNYVVFTSPPISGSSSSNAAVHQSLNQTNSLLLPSITNSRLFSSEAPKKKTDGDEIATSSDSSSANIEMRLIPTRHSRHHVAPVAPASILDKATDEILKSMPGTLYGKYEEA